MYLTLHSNIITFTFIHFIVVNVLGIRNLCQGTNRNITMSAGDTFQINFDMRIYWVPQFPRSCGCAIESNADNNNIYGRQQFVLVSDFLERHQCHFGCIEMLKCASPDTCSLESITNDVTASLVNVSYMRFIVRQETARPEPSSPHRQDIIGSMVFTGRIMCNSTIVIKGYIVV